MIRAQRRQGGVFILCALAVSAACVVLPRMNHSTELTVVAGLVLLLGVPHGALDPLFARRLAAAKSAIGWVAIGLGYALLAIAVVGLWVVAPSLFLAGFLLISAAHFSGDPGRQTGSLSRLLYGGGIIVIPALLHSTEVETLFAALAGHAAASSIMPVLQLMSGPWLFLLIVCAAIEARRDPLTGAELATLGALALIAPPLVAFATFFCAMHSPRHILRTADYSSDLPKRVLWTAGLAPMLIVFGAVAASWFQFGDSPIDDRIVQIMFVGLAALTVPHMVLVERVRLAGWRRSKAGLVSSAGSPARTGSAPPYRS